MKKCFLLLSLLLFNACAINRAPSENLLEKRADFEGVHQIKDALEAMDNPLLMPVRTEPVIADIWVHPHELPSGDYFRGAWIRTIVTRSSWSVEEKLSSLLLMKDTKEAPKTENNPKFKGGLHEH